MYKPSHKDFACLINILDSIEKIKEYSEPFDSADDWYLVLLYDFKQDKKK